MKLLHLKPEFHRPPGFVFRHEIASLFFLSIVSEKEQPFVIDMIVAHHKSIYHDVRGLGLLDLDENIRDSFERHSKDFEIWSKDAMSMLNLLGLNSASLSLEDAKANYYKAIEHCENKSYGYSLWKGVCSRRSVPEHKLSGLYMELQMRIALDLQTADGKIGEAQGRERGPEAGRRTRPQPRTIGDVVFVLASVFRRRILCI